MFRFQQAFIISAVFLLCLIFVTLSWLFRLSIVLPSHLFTRLADVTLQYKSIYSQNFDENFFFPFIWHAFDIFLTVSEERSKKKHTNIVPQRDVWILCQLRYAVQLIRIVSISIKFTIRPTNIKITIIYISQIMVFIRYSACTFSTNSNVKRHLQAHFWPVQFKYYYYHSLFGECTNEFSTFCAKEKCCNFFFKAIK